MRRLLSVRVLLTAVSGTVLVGGLVSGCGDSTGDDQAGDGASTSTPSGSATSSAASASPTSSGSPSPTSATSSVAPQLPACDAVWVDGATLPFSYHGCVDGDRTVKAQKQPCEMGKPLVTYRNRFWAAAGGPIHEVAGTLAKDQGWHRALIQCGG